MKSPDHLYNKKILIVDDAGSIRMLTQAILLDAGFKYVKQAKDGIEAFKKIRTLPIDLIICDWNMPGLSGLELFKRVNNDPELKKVAFIMLTSSSEGEKVKEAIKIGVTSYILKPFKPEVLLQNIAKVLSVQ